MRLVVLADGHQMRAGHQNIRRLQHRVANQAEGDRFVVDVRRPRHILKARQTGETRQRDQHLEDEIHLIHRMHRRLEINRGFTGIHPHGEVVQHHLADVRAHLFDVLACRACGEHMEVCYQKVALVLVLEFNAILQ